MLTSAEPNNPYQSVQQQIWHRMSNSFQGDTVQLGLSLSDNQMRNSDSSFADMQLYTITMKLYPGPILA